MEFTRLTSAKWHPFLVPFTGGLTCRMDLDCLGQADNGTTSSDGSCMSHDSKTVAMPLLHGEMKHDEASALSIFVPAVVLHDVASGLLSVPLPRKHTQQPSTPSSIRLGRKVAVLL